LYSGGMNVTSGTYHTDEDVRVTALLYRSADESKYRMEMWCQDAVVASDQLAGLASGIEELLTRFRLGAGYSTSGQLPTCDCAIGFGISRDDAEYIHDFLYNEGAHRSTRELPATSYFVHLYRLDRIGAGESVLDTDDEIQDEIGSWHLVNAAAPGEPTWDTNAPPYSLPSPPSIFDDPEVVNTEIATGEESLLFEATQFYLFGGGECTLTFTSSNPDKVSLTDEAIANGGYTVVSPGVYSLSGSPSLLTARAQGTPFKGLEAGAGLTVTAVIDSGSQTATLVRSVRVIDPDITVPITTVGRDESEYFMGEV